MKASDLPFPAELGGPCALQTLQRKNLPYYLFMLVKTSLDGRKKKKRQKQQQQQPDDNKHSQEQHDEEEHRTSIYCSQFPVEVLKMFNDEPDAHVVHNLLTMSANTPTSSDNIINTLGEEASILVLTDQNAVIKQITQVSSQISRYYYYYAFQAFEPYPPEEEEPTPAAAATTTASLPLDDDQPSSLAAQRLRTRRRGRKTFRYDFASIFGPVHNKETAQKLHAIWNERTRTIKSRAAISRALAEILELRVGLNVKLISGNPSMWDVKIVDGVLQLERKSAAATDKKVVAKIDI